MTLYEAWLEAKARETVAVADRRKLEDQMVVAFHVPKNLDTTISHEIDGYKIKLEGRINKKIDAEKLQVIAAEAGLSEHLTSLFRWKPEIIAKAWGAADEAITKPLLDAITSTPGRPTFTITKD